MSKASAAKLVHQARSIWKKYFSRAERGIQQVYLRIQERYLREIFKRNIQERI